MSIAGGFHRALVLGSELGCETIQVFTKSPGNWMMPSLPDEEVERWSRVRGEAGITPVIAHDCYLVNLASRDRALRKKSVKTLSREVRRAVRLGISLFVIHPGAHTGGGEREGLKRVSGCLDLVLSQHSGSDVTILLETTAGQGTSLGYRFEHLAAIMEACSSKERLGVCLDTCHLFAAGYDIRDEKGYASVIYELDAVVGLDKVHAIHMNDSKKDLASRVDRHEHIGKGKIGLKGFSLFLSDERLSGLPFIIETPKGEGGRLDRQNLKVLKNLRRGGGVGRFQE